MNRTIILLTVSDIFLLTGFGLMQPILAIFIKENLIEGTIFVQNLQAGCLLLQKVLCRCLFPG